MKRSMPLDQKKHFVISTLELPPWQYKKQTTNGSITYQGIIWEIFHTLAEYLNFDYEIREPSDGMFGALHKNGSWSGIFGQLIRKEADIGAAGFYVTFDRSNVVDYLYPFWYEDRSFITKIPRENKRKLYVHLFESDVWWTLIATIVTAALTTTILDTLSLKNKDQTLHKISTNTVKIFQSFGNMVNQGCHQPPQLNASRVFTSCYWILIITTVAIYSGNLFAFSTIKRSKLPLKSLEDLAGHPTYQAIVQQGTSIKDIFEKAKGGLLKKIWEKKIKVNPKNVFHIRNAENFKAVLHTIRNENIVFIGPGAEWKYLLGIEGYCDIIIYNTNLPSPPFAFPVHKGFQYTDMFNKKIVSMVESGLILKWYKDYMPKENNCDKSLSSIRHSQAQLETAKGAFIVLSVGLTVSTAVFLLENCSVKFIKIYKCPPCKWRRN